jgi:hypothetical protein
MADSWQTIVASSLDWEQAHASLESAVEGLEPSLRGRRPDKFPHSIWELLEHIRLAQADLLAFMEDASYKAPRWPQDYWPASPAPSRAGDWDDCLGAIRRDRARLAALTTRADLDLTAKIPWGDGQTYLRTILVVIDHTAYHVGQVIDVRRLLGAWPAA